MDVVSLLKKKWVQNMHFANYGAKNFKTLFSNTKSLSNQTFRNTFPKIWGKNKTYFPYQNSALISSWQIMKFQSFFSMKQKRHTVSFTKEILTENGEEGSQQSGRYNEGVFDMEVLFLTFREVESVL